MVGHRKSRVKTAEVKAGYELARCPCSGRDTGRRDFGLSTDKWQKSAHLDETDKRKKASMTSMKQAKSGAFYCDGKIVFLPFHSWASATHITQYCVM